MTKTKTRRQRGSGSLFRWKNTGPWWLKFYKAGKPILESCKTTDRRAAERLLAQRLAEIATDTYTPTSARKATVQELIDDLLIEYKNNNRKSIGHLGLRWRLHLRPFFGGMTAAQVTGDSVGRYVNQRKQQGAASASCNRELAILKRAFSLGLQNAKVRTAPRITMLKENNVRTGFLSSKDRDALANACARIGGLWMRGVFELASTYGWRLHELVGKNGLKVSQVDFTANSIRLEVGSTKNGEGRQVSMTSVVRSLLTQCVVGKAGTDHVFTRPSGEPVMDFRRDWIKACTDTGIPQLLFHDLRRSACRALRNAGVAEGVIMRIGGWKTRSMFDRYSIISTGDVADALVKLERQREAETVQQAAERQQEAEPVTTRPI